MFFDSGGFFLFSILASGITTLPIVALVALVIVLALRGEPDEGTRAPAIYLAIIGFVGSLVLLVAATAAVGSLVQLSADGDSFDDGRQFTQSDFEDGSQTGFMTGSDTFPFDDGGDADDRAIAGAVQAALFGVAAAAVLLGHGRPFRWVASLAGDRSGARVHRAYSLLVCVVSMVLLVVAAGMGAYFLFQFAAPGVTAVDSRGDALRDLVPMLTLGLGSLLLVRFHWAWARIPSLPSPATDH